MFWPSVGLGSVVLSWLGLIYLIQKWRGDVSMTFSQHAAKHKSARIYYALLWTLVLPPLFLFLLWLADEFNFNPIFTILLTTATIFMYVAAYVPETVGWKVSVHRFFAFGMSLIYIPMIIMISMNEEVAGFVRIYSLAAATIMFVQFVVLLINKGEHPKMLYIQGSYVALFESALLLTAFLG